MDKIQLHPEVKKPESRWTTWGIGLLTDDYRCVNEPSSCRTWVDDTIWARKTGKKEWGTVIGRDMEARSYSLDKYNLLMMVEDYEKDKKSIEKNLNILHTLEDKYGLKRTEVFDTNIKGYFVFHGDPIWHSEVWKSSLYTNYLKTLWTNDYYTAERDKWEQVLWTMVTKDNDEILQPNNGDIHGQSGFVSLINGDNLNSPKFRAVRDNIHTITGTPRISKITGLPVRKYVRKG